MNSFTVEEKFLEWNEFMKTQLHSVQIGKLAGFLHLLHLKPEIEPVKPKEVQQKFISNLTIYFEGTIYVTRFLYIRIQGVYKK